MVLVGLLAAVLACAIFPAAIAIAGPASLVTLIGAGVGFGVIGGMVAVLVTCLGAAGASSAWLAIAGGIAFVVAAIVIVLAIISAIQVIKAGAEQAAAAAA